MFELPKLKYDYNRHLKTNKHTNNIKNITPSDENNDKEYTKYTQSIHKNENSIHKVYTKYTHGYTKYTQIHPFLRFM